MNDAARTRLARLPQPRHPYQRTITLLLATLIVGFTVKWVPGLAQTEFRLDQALSRHHNPPLNVLALSINTVLSPPGIVAIMIVVFLLLLLVTRSPVNAIAVGVVATLGWLSSEAFKIVVAQPRPNEALLQNPLVPSDGSGSFPSGHTTFAVSLAVALYFFARGTRGAKATFVGGVLVVLVVGASRLYLGVHYPSDVLGSVLAAATTISLVTYLWNRFGMMLLNRIPWLSRIGPIPPAPTQPRSETVPKRRPGKRSAQTRKTTGKHN
jgi:membrane-associated phospholipid phosphatase